MNNFIFLILFFKIATSFSQNQVLKGKFEGTIGISTNSIYIVTFFENQNNTINGSYKYGAIYGDFTDCVLDGSTLSCNWTESKESKGQFNAIFNESFKSFIGIWYYYSGAYGGAWTGKKSF